jgi:hypothetical protein
LEKSHYRCHCRNPSMAKDFPSLPGAGLTHENDKACKYGPRISEPLPGMPKAFECGAVRRFRRGPLPANRMQHPRLISFCRDFADGNIMRRLPPAARFESGAQRRTQKPSAMLRKQPLKASGFSSAPLQYLLFRNTDSGLSLSPGPLPLPCLTFPPLLPRTIRFPHCRLNIPRAAGAGRRGCIRCSLECI